MQGQRTYDVPKEKLLNILKVNREDHIERYNIALGKWKAHVISALKSALANAQDGTEFKTNLELPKPRLHDKEYDHVIGLLELTSEEFIKIDNHDYKLYVLDEWNWKQEFMAVNASYGIE